ncbi:MAG: hypothetical protein GX049_14255 [Alcaligenaceae bacterium]|nr:hypothetical protein [Alcaligenaceae bacterium]
MGKNVRQGIAEVSEGEKWEWYGSGKTSFAGTRKLELNYSVATTIDAGISSKLTVGASSSVAWDNSIKAEFGASMKYSASKTIEFKRSAGFSHQDAYAGTVGADAVHNLNIRKVSIALKIVLSIQTVLVLALLGTVAGVQIKNQDKVVDVYTGKENGLSLNVIASITTAITTVLSILTIYWAKNKSFLEKNNPAAAVTLDAAQGVFMGMNRSGTLAGLTMNTKAIDLAIAPTGTLNYLKPKGSSSIIGITQADTLGTAAAGGTRLKLAADGTINLN